MKVTAENPAKYLSSRLGIVNESFKKAYLSGKRIIVLLTDELDLVVRLIALESVIRVRTGRTSEYENPKTREKAVTHNGYNSVQYTDSNPHFIKQEASELKTDYPTLYLHTGEGIPYESLLNYARHYSGLTSFRDASELKKVNTLKQSVIMIVTPEKPGDSSESSGRPSRNRIPDECAALTEYIQVPYLGEEEFEDILSVWLHENEGLPLESAPHGYSRISDSRYLERLYQAMRALSPAQIRSCLTRCQLEYGNLYHANEEDPRLGRILKAVRAVSDSIISRSSALSLIDATKGAKPDGLKEIIDWLDDNTRRITNPGKYEKFRMIPPKGILLSGIPGSGKSMLAKYIAARLKLSLVRLDLGDALGGYVGDSEKGFRTALEVAESLSPCVLWIDEMEKMFEGGHEVTRRLIGKFLTWMQEKTDRGVSCFVYATANDISKMPPEMFRTGRFDKKFYTFMPSAEDCADIFASLIHHQNVSYENEYPDESCNKKLFNERIINRGSFLKLLDSDICLKDKVIPDDSGVIPRSNKFFIGSDIEQLIVTAKSIYLNKYMDGSPSEASGGASVKGDAVFDSVKFLECVREAVGSMKTYGETSLDKIAYAYAEIARNNFAPASCRDIMPVRGYDEAGYRQAVRKDPKTPCGLYHLKDEAAHLHKLTHEYDRQLYLTVSKTLNSISRDIIEREK